MQPSQSSNLLWCCWLVQPPGIFAAESLTRDRFGVLMHQSHLLPEGQILLCYPTMFCFLPILLIFPGIDVRAIEATILGIVFNNSCNISLLFF